MGTTGEMSSNAFESLRLKMPSGPQPISQANGIQAPPSTGGAEMALGLAGAGANIIGAGINAGMSLYAIQEQRKEAKKVRRANMKLWREQKRMAERQFQAEHGLELAKFGEQKVQNAADRYLGYVKSIDDMFTSNTQRFTQLATLQHSLAQRRR